jgi:1-aminocyclopropane-1-carboxylate deaminase/D-cysteine desulfhydrase-like pyridoxal-dependent ACC family enzyme
MIIKKLIQQKLAGHQTKIDEVVTAHGAKSTIANVKFRTVNLIASEDRLIPVEVRAVSISGWIYDSSLDFVTYLRDGTYHMISLHTLKVFVEGAAKKYGKLYSETPKPYHTIKEANGAMFYYIKEDDFLQLEMLEL